MTIPKILHYCWFGGAEKPPMIQKCLKSWRKRCPDYDIREWNERNYDFSGNRYAREAYEAKQWAFVTDVVRLDVLYRYGGIYFDTDVEILKPLDAFLNDGCFLCIENCGGRNQVASGLGTGAEPAHPLIGELLADYRNLPFLDAGGRPDQTTCTVRTTEILKRYGFAEENRLQRIAGAVIYPSEYFSPMHMESGLMQKTKHTVTIHHYSLSWTSPEHQAERRACLRQLRQSHLLYELRTFPNRLARRLLGDACIDALKHRLGR